MPAKRKPRDPAMLETRLKSVIALAAGWRKRALAAEREVERLTALREAERHK